MKRRDAQYLLCLLTASVLLVSCQRSGQSGAEAPDAKESAALEAAKMTIKVQSAAFSEGGMILKKHAWPACGGQNASPPFHGRVFPLRRRASP